MQWASYLPTLGTHAPAGHCFTPMPRRVEKSKPLVQGMWRIGNGCDYYVPAFHRDANPLIDAEMRLTGNGCGYADTQVIAPLFDIEYSLGHELLQEKCLNISLDALVPPVNATDGKESG